MYDLIYVLITFVLIFIQVITLAMSLRAILGWIFQGGNRFTDFLYILTEPAIMPMRRLFVKMNWFQQSPLDFSFLFTYIALGVIELFLGSFLG